MEMTEIHKQILEECTEDYVGLWSIIWAVNGGGYSIHEVLPEWVREKTMRIVQDLLESGFVEVGNFEAGGFKFQPMLSSTQEMIDFIQREWDELGKPPTIGDVCWFQATAAGKQLANNLGSGA
jgi:hypothetical protein